MVQSLRNVNHFVGFSLRPRGHESQLDRVLREKEGGSPLQWLGRFQGPVLRRDDQNYGLRPDIRLNAFPQCASEVRYVPVRITVIHSVR
jgi:hypothetical protein